MSKYDFDFMNRIAAEHDGKCLSESYINVKTKLLWECKSGHTWSARPDHVIRGSWCPKCSIKRVSQALKSDFGEVKALAQKLGGECLSESYTNSNEKLLWKCAKGHTWKAKYSHVKNSGYWCPKCSTQLNVEKLRLGIKVSRELAKKRNGKCISTEYHNGHTKMLWECVEGHTWYATTSSVRAGSWCKICSRKKAGEALKLTINEMRQVAFERDGKCLSNKYIDSKTKLLWECSEGHTWYSTPMSVKKGSWCPTCSGVVKGTIEQMRTLAKDKGGECLSENYMSANSKLLWKCSKGHVWEAVPSSIKRGSWCKTCQGLNKKTLQDMQTLAEERNGKCLSKEYINADSSLKWSCSNGHTWSAPYYSIYSGTWCPRCTGRLNEEKCRFIFEKLTGLDFNKTRKLLRDKKELDGYNDLLKIGFEYQGEQHFQFTKTFHKNKNDFSKQELRDREKRRECSEKGILLIEVPYTIASDQEKIDFIKSQLTHLNLVNKGLLINREEFLREFYEYNSQLNKMKSLAERKGGKCLSNEYINASTKIVWECSEGHVWKAVPYSIQNGTWCPECAKSRVTKSNRLSVEQMKELAQSKGGKCLSTIYINSHTKLTWQCSVGHIWKAVPTSILRGSWCNICSTKRAASKLRNRTIVDMKEIAQSNGGLCLSKEYVNSNTKLTWKCSKGHIWEAIPSSILRGSWCKVCKGLEKKDLAYYQDIAKKRNGMCLSKNYINAKSKLTWKCSEGHIWEAVPSHVQNGSWCPECYKIKRKNRSI